MTTWVTTAREDITQSLKRQRAVDLAIVAVEDTLIRATTLRLSSVTVALWLCDIDNRYERMFDPDSLMNERCFSADCPCWRYSSIPVKRILCTLFENPHA